jgi:predicted TIM-barrel fold metal-dependent hydrolase
MAASTGYGIPIADVHVHVGRFRDRRYRPREILSFLDRCCVGRFAMSSTAAAVGLMEEAEDDLREAVDVAGPRVWPLLWVPPCCMRGKASLDRWLQPWYRGLKVHGGVQAWDPKGAPLRRLFAVAREHNLPLFLHTGGCSRCDAGIYQTIIIEHPEVTVILAHARPIDQASTVLRACSNVWVDTAFVPLRDLRVLVDAGLGARILFGSDAPIDRCFHRGPPGPRYRARVERLDHAFPQWAPLWWGKNPALVFGS